MGMTKRELVEKIRELLRTDADLGFLLQLGGKELETLAASIRERIVQERTATPLSACAWISFRQ